MDLDERLAAVLPVVAADAAEVDATGAFPGTSVAALRETGLLGLTLPTAHGGLGGGPVELVAALRQIAAACGSTAMVYLMHVAATMAVAAAPPPGRPNLLRELASGANLATLAFSEPGSRSHFWAPTSQAQSRDGGETTIKLRKSFVTSAGHADVYLVSTRTSPELAPAGAPLAVDVFVVDGAAPGVEVAGRFQGLGLRGNASAPMTFDLVANDRLGEAGSGFSLMLDSVLPWFNLGNAAVSLGLSRAAVDAAVTHTSGARLEHAGQALAELPTIRAQLARAALELETTASYVTEAARAVATRDDPDRTTLRVLGAKAVANDAALRITDTAMRVCGGAAFSRQLPIERFFRDARAGSVMAPTADVLYDFYGKAITGQQLF